MRSGRRAGTTLIEIMLSLVIVLIGMLALFKILGSSIRGSSTAAHMSQAQARARWIIESIRTSPPTALQCLATTPAANWDACEQQCRAALPLAGTNLDSCIYTMASMSTVPAPQLLASWANKGQTLDRNGQAYTLITDPKASFVLNTGLNLRVYDAQVTVGWNDDGTATQAPDHRMVFRTAVFQ